MAKIRTPGDIVLANWRVGRKVGRTIYAMVGTESDCPMMLWERGK